MKLRHLYLLLLVLSLSLFIMAPIDPEELRGNDISNIRCDGGIITLGDLMRDVQDKCGDPIRETYIDNEPFRIWIYQFGQSDYLNYIGFIHGKVNRMYNVRCDSRNPDCQ